MQKIFEDNYLILEFDKRKRVFMYTWKPGNDNLNMETFLLESKKILEEALKSKASLLIDNGAEFSMTIPLSQPENDEDLATHGHK